MFEDKRKTRTPLLVIVATDIFQRSSLSIDIKALAASKNVNVHVNAVVIGHVSLQVEAKMRGRRRDHVTRRRIPRVMSSTRHRRLAATRYKSTMWCVSLVLGFAASSSASPQKTLVDSCSVRQS